MRVGRTQVQKISYEIIIKEKKKNTCVVKEKRERRIETFRR